ncbi:hypothetical protein CI610_02878 [invertebrate metagenome]|uniref:Glycosyltransferase subfamily 4-like N-terminal domain-containing protein n=1 Tax=invertebrate metagenome TaxID=1711999 RepID=A0A2H9T4Q9_9ZZZZ
MKKILIITPRFPYPVIGGDRLRIYELCKELSKEYSLTLASLCETKDEINYPLPDDGIFSQVHRVLLSKKHSYFNCLMALPTHTPLQVAYYHSHKFQQLINDLAKDHDLVLPHLIRVADYVKDFTNKKILEMTDAISMNYTRATEIKNNAGVKGIIFKVEKKRLNFYEKKIAKQFDFNVLVSKYDKDFLFDKETNEYKKTLVCSNGVDIKKFSYEFSPKRKEVIFIGNMMSAQNFDAAVWFAKKVMPLLVQKDNYHFKVIGKISPEHQHKLSDYPNTCATGPVDDVILHARGALAGICSVRLAAGVQNKILEYMAMGIPAITSSTGLEGLEAIPESDILVADQPEDYVKHIIYLEKNIHDAKRISENAFRYVSEKHSWSGKLKPVIEAVHTLI